MNYYQFDYLFGYQFPCKCSVQTGCCFLDYQFVISNRFRTYSNFIVMEGWQNPQNFAIGLFIALLFVAALVLGVVLLMQAYSKRIMQEQEKLTQAKVEYQQSLLLNSVLAQEKERERIAKDLHDDLISKLTVLTYALQIENSKVKPVELLNESIKIARRITHDLTPPLLDQTSLKDLIDDFVARMK